jgi:FkbM family methyltransferase
LEACVSGVLRKELANGLVFEFRDTSKIARDFERSVPERPDHVWEPQTTRLALHLAAGARDVVVGGAYFGDQAVPLAHAIAPGGTCHAFEPGAASAALLERNAQLNGLANLRVERRALWSSERTLYLPREDALAGAVEDGDGDSVAATTIDDYLDAAGVDDVQLVLLDLEGGEHEALRGARRRLAAPGAPAVIFEVHRAYVVWSSGLERVPVVADLRALGYDVYAVRDFQSNRVVAGPIELVPLDSAYLDGPPHGFNLVAVKDPHLLQGDAFAIVPGVSPKLLVDGDPALHHPLGGL